MPVVKYLHISDALEMILAIIRTLKEGIYLGVDKVEYIDIIGGYLEIPTRILEVL